jgi:hypothetical protein
VPFPFRHISKIFAYGREGHLLLWVLMKEKNGGSGGGPRLSILIHLGPRNKNNKRQKIEWVKKIRRIKECMVGG